MIRSTVEKSLFVLLVAVVFAVPATDSLAQTRTLTFPTAGKYLVSLPETITAPPITDMAQLYNALNASVGCSFVSRHDPQTDQFLVWDGASCNRCTFGDFGCVNPDPGLGCGCFCVTPNAGQGYFVEVGAGSFVMTAQDGSMNILLEGAGANSASGANLISIPYDTPLATAKALFLDAGGGVNVQAVQRFNTATESFQVYTLGQPDFALNCGDGYIINKTPGSARLYTPPTFGLTADPCPGPPSTGSVWAIQPDSGLILQVDPQTGVVGNSFPAPDPLGPGHLVTGLTIAQGGSSLLYVNAAIDPTTVYRLDPDTGALLSIESVTPGSRGGLGFESGSPDSIFVMNDGAGIELQSGLSGPVAPFLSVISPGFPGASGGDDAGRQFVWAGGLIQEFSPTIPDTVLNGFPSPSPGLSGMAYDGINLYVSDQGGGLFTLDPNNGTVLNLVVVPGGPLTGLGARGAGPLCGNGVISGLEECDPPGPLANPDCCEGHPTPGCSDPTCEDQVCSLDPYCCGLTCDCCTPHAGPGCTDQTCQDQVCQFFPFCCGVEWDATCVDLALQFPDCQHCCDGVWDQDYCADLANQLLDECVFACTDPAVCTSDCCLDSDGDGICDTDGDPCPFGPNQGGEALFQTVRAVESCDCCDTHLTSGCSDQHCESLVCAADPFCCDVEWDSACVNGALGFPECTDCCQPQTFWWNYALDYETVRGNFVPHWDVGGYVEDMFGPGSGNLYVDASLPGPGAGFWYLWQPICPDAGWSSGGLSEIACQPPSDCCAPDNPTLPDPQGCSGPVCESIICVNDPYCCGDSGSDCCTAHTGPGCDSGSCTADVCAIDPSCCLADSVAWGIQPNTGSIVRFAPQTGAILGSFPAPGALLAGQQVAGLTIAEGGTSLLYVNGDADPTQLYRLNPANGAILSIEPMVPAGPRGGLGFESGAPASIFAINDGAGIDLQSGFGGPLASFLSVVGPSFPGASGGDDSGRQFVWAGGLIQEFSPTTAETVLNNFPGPSGSLSGLAYDGQELFVSDALGDVYTLDPDIGAVLNVVNVPGGPLTGLAAFRGTGQWDNACASLAETLPNCISICGYWDTICANSANATEACVNSCNGELCRSTPSPLP